MEEDDDIKDFFEIFLIGFLIFEFFAIYGKLVVFLI
jgi:hypothetical protein